MTESFLKKVADKVYLLGDHYYQAYLVRGKKCAIVETGLSYTVPKIVSRLAELGISPEEVQYLVITHAHFDHVCGAPGLQKAFPEAQTLASAVAARVVSKENVVANHFKEDRETVNNLIARGLLQDYDTSFQPPATVRVDRIMNEGDVVELGDDCSLTFYMTPGHSPCSMSIYLAEEEVLFPSDCLGYPFSNMDIFTMYLSSYRDYLNSIRKVTGLDTSVLALPHAPAILQKENVRNFMHHSLAIAQEVHHHIIQSYHKGHSFEDLSLELFKRYYKENWAVQSEENMRVCTDLVVRRSLEAENIAYTK
ncbi:MAG TPA: MBL fold metallo-hydrolase [Desulfitobacteriaceae bacterium]|nr:MBL fold metallo-hydrolase [Desulfitobacteriaceae bacterium]